MNVQHELSKEIKAAEVFRGHLADLLNEDPGAEDDSELIRDMVEAETSLHEMIEKAALQLAEDGARIASLKELIDKFSARQSRYRTRADLLRTAIQTAMEMGEIRTKLEFPFATLRLGNKAPQVVYTDEEKLPSRFFNVPDPVLDKKAVKTELQGRARELKAAAEITDDDERSARIVEINTEFPPFEGASLDNGGTSLTVRWS